MDKARPPPQIIGVGTLRGMDLLVMLTSEGGVLRLETKRALPVETRTVQKGDQTALKYAENIRKAFELFGKGKRYESELRNLGGGARVGDYDAAVIDAVQMVSDEQVNKVPATGKEDIGGNSNRLSCWFNDALEGNRFRCILLFETLEGK